MKRVLFIPVLLFLFLGNTLIAQKTCENSENLLEDNFNNIKKCLVTSSKTQPDLLKKNRQLVVKPRKTKRRFLKIRKKSMAHSVSNSIHSKGIDKAGTKMIETESLIALEKSYIHKVDDFKTVDKIPVFKNCEDVAIDANQRLCFNKEMIHFINENLAYSDEVLEEGVMGIIGIKFIIDKNGEVNNIETTGHKKARALKESVINLVSRLPTFKPAEKNNSVVPVAYEFLLNFSE